MYIPTRACCYLFREQSTIISTHSMKKAFTYSLARAGKDIKFCYLWYCPIGCMDYISDFKLLNNNPVCIHLNTK